ncbi:hypothetical protein GCM10009780_70950 [Actinomadura alba]
MGHYQSERFVAAVTAGLMGMLDGLPTGKVHKIDPDSFEQLPGTLNDAAVRVISDQALTDHQTGFTLGTTDRSAVLSLLNLSVHPRTNRRLDAAAADRPHAGGRVDHCRTRRRAPARRRVRHGPHGRACDA